VRHLAGCGAVALLASAWIAVLNVVFNPYLTTPAPGPFLLEWSRKFWSGLLSYLLLYAFVLVVSHVLDSKERLALQLTETARLNELLSKAQLNALRRQIEPHFLFNTLNAISGLVREQKNDAAVSTIAALSDMLRRVVQDSNRAEVPLSEELEFLERYLEIQTVRFAERLRVTFDVPEELLGAQVPSLILQPLVENAVKHGIAKRTQGGEVRISGSRLNGMVAIRIYNDGPVLREDWQNGGTGVENVRTRLESLYGKKFELSLQNDGSTGVEVLVSMPYKEK
jgi:LytS/YehU family sensor histidine kinase